MPNPRKTSAFSFTSKSVRSTRFNRSTSPAGLADTLPLSGVSSRGCQLGAINRPNPLQRGCRPTGDGQPNPSKSGTARVVPNLTLLAYRLLWRCLLVQVGWQPAANCRKWDFFVQVACIQGRLNSESQSTGRRGSGGGGYTAPEGVPGKWLGPK
jgi:hypothetical protein